mmetsp:Transcript_19449/g.27488  ORF Transcript_19449/g.27488 Transcript_19449/m.27488 type:complete len:209 (+) Transcript_19449:564-1190(+)
MCPCGHLVKKWCLAIIARHGKIVSVLEANPTWLIWNFMTDNNISITRPISVWNDDVRSCAIKQTTATLALDIYKPLFESYWRTTVFKFLVNRGHRTSDADIVISILFCNCITLTVPPELKRIATAASIAITRICIISRKLRSFLVAIKRDARVNVFPSPLPCTSFEFSETWMGINNTIAKIVTLGKRAANRGSGNRTIISHGPKQRKR